MPQIACDAIIAYDIAVQSWLTGVKSSSTTLATTNANLKQTMLGVDQTLNVGIKQRVTDLGASVMNVLTSAKCGFIGVSYRAFKQNVCTTFVSALSMIALCSFAIGMLNFAVIVCATVLSKRMQNPKSEDAALVVELSLGGMGGAGQLGAFGVPLGPSSIAMTSPSHNKRE